ncbi:MAG TPA: hypothetical protein VFQ44_16495 [Streptosporangiaceae bacterium]|nr:hypothetical protein [Streptosporangiaceae bacterium]
MTTWVRGVLDVLREDTVELIAHYSNTPELLSDLRRTVEAVTTMIVEEDELDVSTTAPTDRPWQLKDRLSSGDISQLIESFKGGTTIPELASVAYLKSRTSQRCRTRPGVYEEDYRVDTL